ncbi:MAG: hypothetical protein ACRDOO_14315 [Actinomadura sp.]
MDRPARVSGAEEVTWAGTSDAISDLTARYRALPGRRLVILGGPGAGKTTLAVQLVRELLRRPEKDEPVPVLLSVSSWDPRVTDDIWAWLRGQIELAYPSLTPEEVGALVADKCVFPVLDGLDEVPSAVGESVLWALNRSLDDGPVIITCRTDDYRRLIVDRGARELVAAAVIDSMPLPGPVAAEYLESRLPRLLPSGWQRILERLRTDPDAPLTGLCASPLGLWLLCASYVEGDQRDRALGYSPGHPGDLDRLTDRTAYPDVESLRAHLYNRLIPVLISFRKPARDSDDAFRPRRLHSAPDTARRLSFLAHLLSEPRGEDGRPRTRDLAWWEVAVVTDRAPATAGVVVGAVVALLFTAGLTVLAGPVLGVLAGLAVAAFVGLDIKSRCARWAGSTPGSAFLRPSLVLRLAWLQVRLGFSGGRTKVIGSSLLAAVLAWFADRSGFDALRGLGMPVPVAGAILGAALGLADTMSGLLNETTSTPTNLERVNTPRESLRGDRTLNILHLAFGVVTYGAPLGIVAAATVHSWLAVFPLGFGIGVLAVLLGRTSEGDHRAWLSYLAATAELRRAKRLPLRWMAFLDDAHRLGLLRTVGPVYQFRHAELQDHLSRRYREEETSRPHVPQ